MRAAWVGSLLTCEIVEQTNRGQRLESTTRRNAAQARPRSADRLSQILRLKPGLLRYLRQEDWAEFIAVVKCECVIGPSRPFEATVRAGLPSHGLSNSEQRGQQLLRFDRR